MSLALGREGNLAWVLGIFQWIKIDKRFRQRRSVYTFTLYSYKNQSHCPTLYIIYSTTHLLEVENA